MPAKIKEMEKRMQATGTEESLKKKNFVGIETSIIREVK